MPSGPQNRSEFWASAELGELHRKDLTLDDADPSATKRFDSRRVTHSPQDRRNRSLCRQAIGHTDSDWCYSLYEFVQSSTWARTLSLPTVSRAIDSCILGQDSCVLVPYEIRSTRLENQRQAHFTCRVMEPLGNFLGQSRDNSIFVPITTFDKYYPDEPFPQVVFVTIVRPIPERTLSPRSMK